MAVTLSTKFYQAAAWKDLSKIVFTSPNIDSPAAAGTRSHILPGQGNLGLWYEDSSSMYRIEDAQDLTSSDLYNFRMKNKILLDVDAEPSYIDVKDLNYGNFATYVAETAVVDVIGYKDVTTSITNISTRLEYTPMQRNQTEITSKDETYITEVTLNDSILCQLNYDIGDDAGCAYKTTVYAKQEKYRQKGWIAQVIPGDTNCHLTFTFEYPVKISYIEMKSYAETIYTRTASCPTPCTATSINLNTTTSGVQAFIGQFNIQAANSTVSGTTWTTYGGTQANTNNTTKAVYFSNTTAYKYYRLNILSNTGLTAPFNNSYYGVRCLRFYTPDYSTNPGSSNVLLYELSNENNNKVIEISNAYAVQSTVPTSTVVTTNHAVTGSITMIDMGGYSRYEVKLRGDPDQYDYVTSVSGNAATISGVGATTGTTFLKADKQNVLTFGTVNYPVTNTIQSVSSASTTASFENKDYVGMLDIAYDTVVSGTVVSGTDMCTVTGITSREVSSTLYAKKETHRLITDDYITGSGTVDADTQLYVWGYDSTTRPLDMDTSNSIVFEVTAGEAYSCRLTAWDDVTHSTTTNELIAGDYVRISAMAYCAKGTKESPTESQNPINLVFAPVHNKIIKGNVVDGPTKYYYGDFNLVYRFQADIYGDYLIFKPILYGIDESISYGVKDFIIALHYSYT